MKKMERLDTQLFRPMTEEETRWTTGAATRRGTGHRTGALPNPDFAIDSFPD